MTLRPAAVVAVAVGATRVYLGGHSSSDVLGGFTVGAAASAILLR